MRTGIQASIYACKRTWSCIHRKRGCVLSTLLATSSHVSQTSGKGRRSCLTNQVESKLRWCDEPLRTFSGLRNCRPESDQYETPQHNTAQHNTTQYVWSMQLRLRMPLVHRCVTVVQLLCAPSPANFDGKLMHSRASEKPGCAVARLVVAASNLHRTAPWPKKLCKDLDQKCWDLCDRCVYQCVLIGPSPMQ